MIKSSVIVSNKNYYNKSMRTIVNISLSKELSHAVEKSVRSGRYASKSEFFRDLLRMWMEGRLFKELEESREELAEGRGRRLRSLKALR